MAIFNSKLLVYQRIYLHIFTVINRFNPTRSQFTWHPRRCEDACIYGGTMVSTWQPYKAGMVICACQIWTGKWEWHAHRIEISSMHAFGKVSRLKGDAAAWTQVSVLVPLDLGLASAAAAVRNCLGPSRGFLGVIVVSYCLSSQSIRRPALSCRHGLLPGLKDQEIPKRKHRLFDVKRLGIGL
jgi:hypothetical protein